MKTGSTLIVVMMLSFSGLGCIHTNSGVGGAEESLNTDTGIFVTGPDGESLDIPPLPLEFVFSDVGEEGAEPSIGITSSGCIFFIEPFDLVRRSWRQLQVAVSSCQRLIKIVN